MSNISYFEITIEVRKQKLKHTRIISIDHCNISLSTISPMLQHNGMEVFDHSGQCSVGYLVSFKIPDTRYLIFLNIVQYEATTDTDTDTDTDIITALEDKLKVAHSSRVFQIIYKSVKVCKNSTNTSNTWGYYHRPHNIRM